MNPDRVNLGPDPATPGGSPPGPPPFQTAPPATSTARAGRLWLMVAMLAAAGLLSLSAWRQGWFTPTADVYLDLPHVSGVQAGTPVKLKGFKIGEVDEVSLQPSLNVRVRLRIAQAKLELLGTDATARFGRDGPIGGKYIEITPGTRQGPRLEAGRTVPVDVTGDFEDVMATVKTAVEKLTLVLAKVDPILDDTRKVTGEVAAARQSFRASADAIVSNFQALSVQLRQAGETASGMATDLRQDRKALVAEARNVLLQAEAATASARAALKAAETDLPVVLANMREISADTRHIVGEARQALPPLVRSGRTAADNAAELSDGLKRSWPLSTLVKPAVDGNLPLDGFEGAAR